MRHLPTLTLALATLALAAPGCPRDDDDPAPPAPTLGGLVSTFGTGGVVTVNPSTRESKVEVVLSDGTNLYLIGYDEMTGSGDFQIRIEKRLESDGSLVTGFGTGGVVLSNPSSGDDHPTAAMHDGTNLYVACEDETNGAGDTQWRVEKRSLSTGALDGTFGSGTGVATSNPSTRDDGPEAILTDGTDLYIVGRDEAPSAGDYRGRVEKWDTTNGAPVTGWASSGVLIVAPGAAGGDDQLIAGYHDGTDLYFAGYDESLGGGDLQWRIQKHTTGTGALVTAFGSGGVYVSNPGPGQDAVFSLDSDGTDLFVFGIENTFGGGMRARVLKLSLSAGAPVTAFGSAGVVTVDPTPSGVDFAGGRLMGSDLYVAGTADIFGANPRWFVEKLSATTGAANPGFGGGGRLFIDPSGGYDELTDGIPVGTGEMVLVGSDSTAGVGNEQWRIERRTR